MRTRVLIIKIVTRIVERIASLVSRIQMLMYGLLPALLPPEELTALVRTYYGRSYESLTTQFHACTHKWTLESWEEGVAARHMAIPGTVVVLGAGLGRESLVLAQRGHRVIGLDNNYDGLLIAARRASEQHVGVAFVQADFQRLPVLPLKADYVFMSGVMYSAIPGRQLRQACVRHFRETVGKDGKVILNFVLSHELHSRTHRAIHRFNRWILKLPGSNHSYQLGDFCSHGHFMHAFLNEAELRSELTETGATILELSWDEAFVVISWSLARSALRRNTSSRGRRDLLSSCPMNPSTVYLKNPDYVQRDVAGECILVPIRRTLPESNSIYVLNETGAALWNRIDGKRSVQAITDEFIQEYDVTMDQLSQDFETLLADLRSIRAIDEVSVADGPTG